MSKRNPKARIIKRLSADEARSIRVRELKTASEYHAEAGLEAHAKQYQARAEKLAKP